MPELPEVETVVRTLKPRVIGRRIIGVEMRERIDGTSARIRVVVTPPEEFKRQLCGRRIENVERYGKNLVLRLRQEASAKPVFLMIHLGMTGRLTVEQTPEFPTRHTHLILALDDANHWIHYSDIRRFGRVRATDHLNSDLGPDPLEIAEEEFFQLLRSRRAMLKSVLLDQHFLRGLGNIYADESLFRAGIHPSVPAACLSRDRASRLYHGIRETLEQAIERGGSSISDYVDADGRRGSFQLLHQVYRRTGKPCLRCGSSIRKMIVASRSTHFCPTCQRRSERKKTSRK